MTALARALDRSFERRAGRGSTVAPVSGIVAVLAALAIIVGARWAVTRLGFDPLTVGALFGIALVAAALAGTSRATRRIRGAASARAIAIGAMAGVVLSLLTVVAPGLGGSVSVQGLGRPAAPFVPWALVTVLVASGEEALLRGTLFGRVLRWAGAPAAIAVTTIAFALMHVPLYGWHVVPLDLAVGLVLGGLRLGTRGIVAPGAAHAVADLASWWL